MLLLPLPLPHPDHTPLVVRTGLTWRSLQDLFTRCQSALKSAFSGQLNQTRLMVRKPYTFPNVKFPKLDLAANQLIQEQKQADASLARLQTLVLDAVARIVEEAGKGTLTKKGGSRGCRYPPTSPERDARRLLLASIIKFTHWLRKRTSSPKQHRCFWARDKNEGTHTKSQEPGRHAYPTRKVGPEFSTKPLQLPTSGDWRRGRSYGGGNPQRRFQSYNNP